MGEKKNPVIWIAGLLVVIGGLNWGLVGLFDFDLVNAILGGDSVYAPSLLSRIVYILVAVSAIVLVIMGCGCCCAKKDEAGSAPPVETNAPPQE